jgi:glycosyltransferase involved in cell wall biosynthesis
VRSTGEGLLRLRVMLPRILRDFRPDVTWSQATLVMPTRSDVPEAVHYRDIGSFAPIHGNSPRRVLKERVERRDLTRADLRIFNSTALRSAVEARYPVVTGLRSVTVHNGLSLEPFTRLASPEVRDRPADAPGAPRILLPQSDLVHKRNPLAADVLRQVRDADPRFSHATLTVAGGGDHLALRARAAELGVADAVHLLGHVPRERMARAYAEADVVLITSSGESFCNPIVESHAIGRPIVLPPLPVAFELRGPLSFIATDGAATSLAAEVIEALAGGRGRDVVAGRSTAAQEFAAGFTATASAGRLRAALSSLVTKQPDPTGEVHGADDE